VWVPGTASRSLISPCFAVFVDQVRAAAQAARTAAGSAPDAALHDPRVVLTLIYRRLRRS
jgi:hypothetical protein